MLAGKIVAQLLIAFVYTIIIIQAVPFAASYDNVNGKIDSPILGGVVFILVSGIFTAISLAVWGTF